jgi:HAD superfamily hydrolase (TIGR02253 family)
MPIKAVLFDLDNTLIDFLKMKHVCCSEAVNSMISAGLPMTKSKAMKLLFEMYEEYGMEYQPIFQEFLKRTMGKVDYGILASGIVAYRRVRSGILEPYPGVEAMLLRLKMEGYHLGIVTDAPRMKAWMRLAAMDVIRYFDFVLTKDDVKGKVKPSRLPFSTAVKKLGISPEEILFVGDSIRRDIAGANQAGMHSCLARYGEKKRHRGSAKPEFSIRNPLEIFKVLERLKGKVKR